MVTGIPPFFEADTESLTEKIKSGVFSTRYPNYESNNSSDIKDLIGGMLAIRHEDRLSVDDCITHKWLTRYTKSFLQVNKKIALDCLNNIKALNIGY